MDRQKNILILGSTGNLGKQVLKILGSRSDYKIVGLSACANFPEILREAKIYQPDFVIIADKKQASQFKKSNKKQRLYTGESGLSSCIEKENIDIVFNCLSGPVGILPTLVAIRKRKKILMANKESLVAAGEIIMREAKKFGAEIIPVDSEHSAIFQCLAGESGSEVDQIILTCSGGYRGKNKDPSIKDLLNHSKWKMGKKITVDSATLMNKGLEVIEAQVLFRILPEKIKVVIHPEVIVHSMVKFQDGAIKALLGPPDMKYPILYALDYPERKQVDSRGISFDKLQLGFSEADARSFPCLKIAYEAAKAGGTAPAALVAADETAVSLYLKQKISLGDIPVMIGKILKQHKFIKNPDLSQILETIAKIRKNSDFS